MDEARLESVLVLQEHEKNRITLRLFPEIDGHADCWKAVVTSPNGEHWGMDSAKGNTLVIEQPELWWPNGYGAQPLYNVRVTLYTNATEQDVWERRIGLRTLSISREKDQWGEEFCHIVNGVKVFAMGADYIPEDIIPKLYF